METFPLPFINELIMWGTLAMQAGVVALLVLAFGPARWTPRWLSSNAVRIAFLLVLGGVLGSFYYSEMAGFAPCVLCWYQRIFIIPQIFLLGIALWRNEERIISLYAAALSGIAFLIALYQLFILPYLPSASICEVGEVSCLTEYVSGFGYIDIPVMSLTLLAVLLLLYRLAWRRMVE